MKIGEKLKKVDAAIREGNIIHVFGRDKQGPYYITHNYDTGNVITENYFKTMTDYYNKYVEIEDSLECCLKEKLTKQDMVLLYLYGIRD